MLRTSTAILSNGTKEFLCSYDVKNWIKLNKREPPIPNGLGGFQLKKQKAMADETKAPEQGQTQQPPELTREERLNVEEKAIQALLEMGVKFSVPLRINPVNPPRRYTWWNKHFPNHVRVWRDRRIPDGWNVTVEDVPDADLGTMRKAYVRHFHVKPLYLGTIDRLRQLYINIEYDEEKIQDQPIQESKKLFRYIPLMAEIAAVAVINNPTTTDPLSKEVAELKRFFLDHLTVPRLKRLADVISQMMNAGGFTYSIRSIREIGTTRSTKPRADRVETT